MTKRLSILLVTSVLIFVANSVLAVEEAGATATSTEGLGNGVAIIGVVAIIAVGAYMVSRAGGGES